MASPGCHQLPQVNTLKVRIYREFLLKLFLIFMVKKFESCVEASKVKKLNFV